MYRVIRASSRPNFSEARSVLKKYDQNIVDVVRRCCDDITSIINEYYSAEDGPSDESIGRQISECKRDYASELAEDYDLSAEEFDEIYNALDTLDTLKAQAYASTKPNRKRRISASENNNNLSIEKLYHMAIRLLDENVGSVYEKIYPASRNFPSEYFVINEWDIAQYAVYIEKGIIYIDDFETLQLCATCENEEEFRRFVKRLNESKYNR